MWAEEWMPNSNLDRRVARFNCFDRTKSSDSRIGSGVDLKAKVERPANGGTFNRQEEELWAVTL